MACSLKPIPDTLDYNAPVDADVTLKMNDHIGMVFIAKAQYDNKQLVPAGTAVSSIQFKVVAGKNRLALVFVFSAGTAGVSELMEVCSAKESKHIRDIIGSEPFQSIAIVGV
jgi:hypothetical protein